MKKEISNWYLALIHASIAGIAVPLLSLFTYGFLIAAFGINYSYAYSGIVDLIIIIITTVLGVMYSAHYINKTFTVQHSGTVALLATAYLAALDCALVVWDLASGTYTNTADIAITVVIGILELTLFYFLSKKYLR